jgi:large subunit ribosomal protein L18
MRTIRRRRFEAKTDYKARLSLLKSEKPRLVIRKTNKYLIVQIVQTEIAQDKVICGSSSKLLLSKGWPQELAGSLKSLAASYLTGYLVGKCALEKGISEAIMDAGMHISVKNSRIYAALKGALDSGMNIPHSKEIIPEIEIIKNDKVSKIFDKIVGGIK